MLAPSSYMPLLSPRGADSLPSECDIEETYREFVDDKTESVPYEEIKVGPSAPVPQKVGFWSPRNPLEEEDHGIDLAPHADATEKHALSSTLPHGRYSFMQGGGMLKAYSNKMPPPVNMPYTSIQRTRDIELKDIMDGSIIPKKGGFECIDKDVLDRQKGLMSDVVRQVLKCVFTGQPISGISLPVRVFEPRSQIERMIDSFGFAPIFLRRAALESNKLERLKYVMTSVIAGMYGSAKQLKPFNPLLGETYQGYFDDGTRIFCEHTSHHPPITNFLLEGPFLDSPQQSKERPQRRMWTISGFYEFTGEKDGDNFKVGQKGPNRLTFHDGHTIEWMNPVFKLSISGSRYMNYTGDVTFYDKKQERKATIILDHTRKVSGWGKVSRAGKVDDFEGRIYSINQAAFQKEKFSKQKIYEWKHPSKLADIKDIKEVICEVKGSWLDSITFDGQKYWELTKYKPQPQRATKNPLPSDWRFREDLIWLKYKKEPYADNWKKELEKMQRLDRKWRKKK